MNRVKCILLFLAVVFLGDRLVSFSARSVIQQSQSQFVRMYQGQLPAKILLLGDSRADRNISGEKVEELTGRSCLNLALGGNNILISEALLKDYVQRYGNPELVIIEVSHSTVDPKSIGEMRIFSYCSENLAALAKNLNPTYTAFESVFTCLKFNDPAFWRLATEAFTKPSSRLLHNTIPREIANQWEDHHKVERPILRENMEALTRICEFANGRNITLRLIISPSWKKFRLGIANFDLWKSALVKASGENQVYDYSEAFFDHDNFFNDEMHLNAAGAHQFVDLLRRDKLF